jgi:hypothetical protein
MGGGGHTCHGGGGHVPHPVQTKDTRAKKAGKTSKPTVDTLASNTTHASKGTAPLACSDGTPAVAKFSPPPVPQRGKSEGGESMPNEVIMGLGVCHLCRNPQPEKEFPFIRKTQDRSKYCRSCWKNRRRDILSLEKPNVVPINVPKTDPAPQLPANWELQHNSYANRWEVIEYDEKRTCGIPMGFGSTRQSAIANARVTKKRAEAIMKREGWA